MIQDDPLTREIISAAIEVHKNLGPGLLESVYEECLAYELFKKNLKFLRQLELPIEYKGVKLSSNLRIDLIVEDTVIVEIKAVDKVHPVSKAQVLTYLKLAKKDTALLINFNCNTLVEGIERLKL